MRCYLGLAAIAAGALLASCAPEKPVGWQLVRAPTMEQLGGVWAGEWKTKDLQGGIAVTIRPATNYVVTRVDGDPYATKYTWQSDVSIKGDTVLIDAYGFDRKETYSLYTDADGVLLLDGSYTFKADPWGHVTMRKQPL